jgi:hypothetical protein
LPVPDALAAVTVNVSLVGWLSPVKVAVPAVPLTVTEALSGGAVMV